MKKIFLFLTICTLVYSCSEKKPDSVIDTAKTTEDVTSTAIPTGKIPSYDFEGLEPLLHIDNDTTYVINFWATWCRPCIKELPAFEKLNATYNSQKVKVVLVSLDHPDILESKVVPFIEQREIKSSVVLLDDPYANDWIPKVDKTWSGAIPATIIYKGGKRSFYERTFTYEELEIELKSIL